MTKSQAVDRTAPRLAVALAAAAATALLLVPSARPGQQSISVDPP